MNIWITAMEAILIEELEPPQNRRRGDDFGASEFIQAVYPDIEQKRIQDLLSEMKKRISG
jgi:hypothetical protein